MATDLLRDRIHTLCRLADHTLGELAGALALHPKVLGRKLNQAAGAYLTRAEAKRLILTLAQWQAINTHQDVDELLALLELPTTIFSPTDWQAAPLNQLEGGDEVSGVPSLAPLSAQLPHYHNLPAPVTRLIGREWAVAQLHDLLRQGDARLLTLVGPGGSGKTRLALAAAASLVDQWPAGVWWIDLTGVRDPQLVVPSIAQTLGVPDVAGSTPLVQLTAYLRTKALLLVLDNLEQVTAAATDLGELLAQAPGLTILATSRAVLGIYGEREWSVPPLDLPDPTALDLQVEQVARYAAVQLFVERAQSVHRSFVLTPSEAPIVAALCARLDGLPLAIELAAARTKLLTPRTILDQLALGHWTVLSSSARNLPPRQQTMQGTVAWSYDLLNPTEQAFFRRLGVFSGGWTLDTAAALSVALSTSDDPLLLLGQLVDQSLVVVEQRADNGVRYRMLEPIRHFAMEQLTAYGEAVAVRDQHARAMLALVERAAGELQGPAQVVWTQRLDEEQDNVRVALGWVQEHAAAEVGVPLVAALGEWWFRRGYRHEGRRWLEAMLALPGPSTRARVEALAAVGKLASVLGDVAEGAAYQEQSLRLARQVGDPQLLANMLKLMGMHALYNNNLVTARSLMEEALTLYQALHDPSGVADMLNSLAGVALEEGDLRQARRQFEHSLQIKRELGNQYGIAATVFNLGGVATHQGDYSVAQAAFEEALALFRTAGSTGSVAASIAMLGQVFRLGGDTMRSRVFIQDALLMFKDVGNKSWIMMCLNELAALAYLGGQLVEAAKLWGAAVAVSEATGNQSPSSERARIEHAQQQARHQVDAEVWDRAWQAGREIPLEQALEYALRLTL